MPQDKLNYNLFVASSNELKPQRDDVDGVASEINNIYQKYRGVRLSTLRWERDTYPQLGRAQQVVNDQIGEYDVLVGMMWKRYGMDAGHPDHRGESGTAEEFRLAREAQEKGFLRGLLFYFFEERFWPQNSDEIEQLRKVFEFRQSLEARGYLHSPVAKRSEFRDTLRRDLMHFIEEELLKLRKTEASLSTSKIRPAPPVGRKVKLRSYEMLVDLKKRRRLKTIDGFDMCMTHKRIMTVVASAAEGVENLIFRHATTGSHIRLLTEGSNVPPEALLRGGDEDILYVPVRRSIKCGDDVETAPTANSGRESQPLEKSYFISLPFTKPGQEILYSLEYANNFQEERLGWAGAVAPGDVDKLTLKVCFPPGKRPGKSKFTFRRGDPRDKEGLVEQPFKLDYPKESSVVRATVSGVHSGEGCALLWDWE